MAGCKTWQGKLTWSFQLERVAMLGERREGYCVKKKRGRTGVKELKNKTSLIPGERSTMLSAQQEEDNHLARSQPYRRYQERAGQ